MRMSSFRKQILQGIKWRSFVDFGDIILMIVFTAVLARLLNRADFGLVAMALLFNRFVRSMTQIGFGTAVIQSQDVTDAQISAVFLIQVAINFFASLACYICAPLVAAFFNAPKLISIVRVIAWILLLNSLAFPQVLLQKRLKFAGFSLLGMGSMLVGNIVAITMALKGLGVWALVFRILISRILYSGGIWLVAGWIPIKPSFVGVGKLFRFGVNMLGSRICNYFSRNLAAIITGKFIGVETLGSFNIAYSLAVVPAERIKSVLYTVLISAFSKIHLDIADFRKKFFASVFSLGAVFIPFMLGLAAVAQNFVVVVYGEKWREAGLFLTFLAVVGMLKGIEHLLRSFIIARGWASVIFGITMIETAVSLPLFFLGAYFFEVIGLVIAYTAASFLSFTLTVRAAQRSVEDNTIFFRATIRTFAVSGAMFTIVLGFSLLVSSQVLLTLCTQIGIGIILYGVLRVKFLTDKERALVRTWPLPHFVRAER